MAFLLFAVGLVLNILMAPKPVEPKPATLADFNVPTAEPGREIPVLFGTYLIQSPNVVWYGDLATSKITTKGGK